MTFDPNRTRVSGTTWIAVWDSLVKLIADSGIVDRSEVLPVLDDEQLPVELPPQRMFITVRLPSLIWAEGDVMIGGGVLSEFWVQGQSRISLWLWNEVDTANRATQAIEQAIAGAQRGARVLARLIRLFWEDDLVDTSVPAQALLKRPMKLISIEPPGAGRTDVPRAWRIVVEKEFNWLLSSEVD